MSVFSDFRNTASQKALIATLLMTVLVAGVIFYLWHFLQEQEQQRLQHEFQNDITEVKTKIAERMSSYGQILKGGRSLFHSSQKVARQKWHDYTSGLDLHKQYPGIQGMGFATHIPQNKLTSHEQEINNRGFENYHVWPPGKRKTYSAIIYLHPFDWRNQRAFGYDMFSEPIRREAMERARDTGLPALTGKVLLVQETHEAPQAGSLLYVAVYQKGMPLNTVHQRRQALTGWVYSPYRMDNLIEGILGQRSDDFHLHIYDQNDSNSENIIYDNTASGESEPHSILIHHSVEIELAGRIWLLNFDGLPAYAQTIGIGSLYKEMAGASLIGILLILLTWNVFNTRNKAELLASELTSSLQESESKFRTIIEASPIPIAFNDGGQNITLLNRQFTEMFGYKLSDIPTLTEWWTLAYPDPDYRQHVMQTWQYAVEKALQNNTEFEPLEFKVRCKDGSARDIQFCMASIGKSSLVLFHDLTERKQAEEALVKSEEQFHQAQKMDAIGTLVGGIAHDFNNMLAGITGNIYLAKKEAKAIPDVIHKLNDVEELSFRAADMIRQLLTFARKGDVSMKPLQLNPFIQEMVKFLSTSVPENIEFHQHISSSPLPINGNTTQLHQVLMNLVNNARDAVEGTNKPLITVTLETFQTDDAFNKKHAYFKSGAYALLSVQDNGCGIPEHQIKQLFEPFFTTKEEGKGTGLGLAMVFGAIKTHKGYIEVESRKGKGSSFHVYLPLQESTELSPALSNAEIIKGNGEKILIVDDNESVRKSSKEILESINYKVIEASDGLEAVALYTSNQDEVSLIITDIVMPRLGGIEAIKQIREICADVKVIFSTGYDKDKVLKGASLSKDIILSKPHNIENLSKTIREQLAS